MMEGKSSDWLRGPSGPTVCRCCFAEGCYKDISTEYFWMGKREVYAEMLIETYDINIAYAQTSGRNSNSRLICEPCISRLRDASEFKRQVQECEKMFLQYLDPGRAVSDLETIPETLEKEVKQEQQPVKEERGQSDDDFDDRGGFDEDDDDLDDQPLTKLASKVPKKESVDLLDLLDNAKAAEKRKSTTKVKTTPAKKVKTKKDTPKATASKPKPEKKKKAKRYDLARSNAETILASATAYPFRVSDKSVLCVYCLEQYEDPDRFRQHMDREHAHFNLAVAFHNLPSDSIKADITDLRCRICSQKFDTLENVAEHLKAQHKRPIDTSGKLGVMPYKLQKDVHNCAVCDRNFPTLFHLNRHTVSHFLGNVCHVCGKSYVASTGLLRHIRSKHQDYQVTCKRCRKVFPTMEAKEKHTRTERSCMRYVCPKCNERFLDWKSRKRHMELAHAQFKRTFRCVDCDVSFNSDNAYYDHFKLHHSRECTSCKHCGLKFLFSSRLKRHLAKHM